MSNNERNPESLGEALSLISDLRYELSRRPQVVVVSEEFSGRFEIDQFPSHVDLGSVYRVEVEDSTGTTWTFVSALCIETRHGSVAYSVEETPDGPIVVGKRIPDTGTN